MRRRWNANGRSRDDNGLRRRPGLLTSTSLCAAHPAGGTHHRTVSDPGTLFRAVVGLHAGGVTERAVGSDCREGEGAQTVVTFTPGQSPA